MNRKQTSEHPVIVALSADTLQALPEQCIALGMKGFVSKPFRVEDVERVLSLIK
jgi:CheY-like chemotaxis protein